ncbi:MAG: site-specific integrase [Sphingomonadales bacterium]|nr:MAG: site-specific integrase [Sphingomonadales bacterium]TNF05510.1 MAG: site-specific integrase [Sphingomonadales bacterium]
MPKAKLDHAYCLTAQCEPGKRKTDHWDIHIPGFVYEKRTNGGTFALRFTDANGRQRQYKIGRFGDITVEQARKAAAKLRAEVVLGGNPQAEKKEKKAIGLYSDLAKQHLEHAEAYIKSHASTEMILRLHILPRWGKMRLDEIKTQDISKWLAEKMAGGLAPATVERIRMTFNRSFELGNRWGVPGTEVNPVKHVTRKKFNNARERFLTPKEAARLHEKAAQSDNTQLASIVALLLLTGARKMELLKAKWADIDLERGMWLIPETKNGEPRYVPLSSQAMTVIDKLPRWEKCEWLIPNPKTKKPYNTIKRAWDTARKAAGMPDLRIHDLRHSFCSSAVSAGVDLYTVGKLVGHKDYKSSQRYSHLANDTLLKAVEKSAANLNVDWGGAGNGV